MIRVLILFEQSGIVHTAFKDAGCTVTSVDLAPNKIAGLHHIQSDAKKFIGKHKDYDLLIAFPPCTYLSSASGREFLHPGYELKQLQAITLFVKLYQSKFKHICIENPRGHIEKFIKATQEIHPYFFGDAYMKRTRLFLKNLPLLQYQLQTDLFSTATAVKPLYSKANLGRAGSYKRSEFHPNTATALASQWTEYIKQIMQHELNTKAHTALQ